jgi:hypothetical protein
MPNRKRVTIEDMYMDARIPHEVYKKTFVASLIMVPVNRTAPVPAIGACWRTWQNFSPGHIAISEERAAEVGEAVRQLQSRELTSDAESEVSPMRLACSTA